MTQKYFIIFFILLVCLYAHADDVEEVKGAIVEYGTYKLEHVSDVEIVLNAPTEFVATYEDGDLLEVTSLVPMQRDMTFGFCYVLYGLKDKREIDIDWHVQHPELNVPTKGRQVEYGYQKTLEVEDGMAYYCPMYTLEESWELVEGMWRFSVSVDSSELISKSFIVVKPELRLLYKDF